MSQGSTHHKEGVEIDEGFIIIKLPLLKKPTSSKSGKTDTLASTGGFKWDNDLKYLNYTHIGVSVNVNGKK